MKPQESIVQCPHCSTRLRVKMLADIILCPSCKKRFPATRQGAQLFKFTLTTTSQLDGAAITSYLGIVSAQVVLGINFIRDFIATFTDAVGGRSDTLEQALSEARETVLRELSSKAIKLGAEAVVGLSLDYETLGQSNGMIMLVATGTAVTYRVNEDVQPAPSPYSSPEAGSESGEA